MTVNHFTNIKTNLKSDDNPIVDCILTSAIDSEYPCTITKNSWSIKLYVTELIIESYSANLLKSVSFTVYAKLKKIVIKDHCFTKCSGLTISNLNALRSVTIGSDCFVNTGNDHLRISNCKQLTLVSIMPSSFVHTQTIALENIESLSCLQFGSKCFPKGSNLVITNCPFLYHLDFPENSFPVISSLTLSTLSKLSHIRFGVNSCKGNPTQFEINISSRDRIIRSS